MNKVGIYHFKIILIRNAPCNNKEELVREERIEYDKFDKNMLLNKLRPMVTDEEKKIEMVEHRKIYLENNKDAIYHEKNKDAIHKRMKKYCEKNKEAIAKRNKKYHEHNKLMKELPFYRVSLTISF